MTKCICMNCGKITEQSPRYASGICSGCGNHDVGFSSIVKREEPELYKWLTSKKRNEIARPKTRNEQIEEYKTQGVWYEEFRKQFDRLDHACSPLCICGKIASSLHINNCQKFHTQLIENTLKALTKKE